MSIQSRPEAVVLGYAAGVAVRCVGLVGRGVLLFLSFLGRFRNALAGGAAGGGSAADDAGCRVRCAALEQRERDLAELRTKVEAGKATLEQVGIEERAVGRMKTSASRLVAVDAGRDAAELRARYPDRAQYLIVSAEFRMRVEWAASDEEPERDRVQGTLRVLGRRIHVPLQFHQALLDALGDDLEAEYSLDPDQPPHYSITLHVGSRYEPWVAGVAGL